ncbi:MAG: hypothetical protein K2Q22_03740 [Cytophagales bacterium]|nr:hypothetical protein [Cytophagales bacterium]
MQKISTMRSIRFYSCLWAILGVSFICNGQDLIILKNGQEISGKIVEIQPDVVKYRPYLAADSAWVGQKKSDIFMVKYASGVKEIFGNNSGAVIKEMKSTPKSSVPSTGLESVFTVSGIRNYFGVSPLGLAVPLGNFGSSDPNNPQSGAAIAGYNASLEFGILPHPNLGIGGQVGMALNGTDNSSITNQLKLKNPTYKWSFEQGNWSSYTFLAGPVGSIPFKKSSLDIKVFVGAAVATSPTFGTSYTPTTYRITVSQSSFTSAAFAWMTGINYRIYLSPVWGVKCHLDFLFSQPMTFDPDVIASSPGYTSTKTIYSFSTSLSMANIGLGVFWNIGN